MPDLLYVNPPDRYDMVLIPAGPAIFGSGDDDPDAHSDEMPQFTAELPGFYMGLYCVTNAQYAKFLTEAKPSDSDLGSCILLDSDCHVVKRADGYAVDDEERYGDHPVVYVSWYGAEAYCEWAGLRLPGELEWEKAARGDDGRKYPWGNEWDATKCRHNGNRRSERTCRVWEYPEGVSVWGLFNPSGNVWEWCADWYDGSVYQRYAKGDLEPGASGQYKVLRGGCWYDVIPRDFRCADRYHDLVPTHRDHYSGFRCARGL